MKCCKILVNLAAMLLVALLLFLTVSPANAQDKPPKDNIIDGELYPHGYTPMEIKNGVYPRDYYPNTEKLGVLSRAKLAV